MNIEELIERLEIKSLVFVSKDAHAAAKALREQQAEIDNAFGMLHIYGVTKERAGSIANGIEVLAARYRKESMSQQAEIERLRSERDHYRETDRGRAMRDAAG